MREPRGHGAMSGAILQPPTRDDADWGVLFIEVSGCLPMCGHGTIGVATVLVETGMVEVHRARDRRAARHAGRPRRGARARSQDGRAEAVTLRNVPAFLHARDQVAAVEGLGEVPYDMAFGGNFYAIVDAAAVGLEVDPERAGELIDAGARIDERDRRRPPVHPADARIAGCHHVIFHAPGRDGARRARRDRDPPRLARPLAVRHGHERADGAAARPRRAGAGRRRSSTSR